MVEPHSSNFRVITTNFLGVRIFRKLTIVKVLSFNKYSLTTANLIPARPGGDQSLSTVVVSYCRGLPCLVLVNRLEGLSLPGTVSLLTYQLDMTSLLTGP